MSDVFTASNGATITVDQYGLILADGSNDGGHPNRQVLTYDGIHALREFFRAEGDKRLGRWRWPEGPDYVVYPFEGASDHVLVVQESAGVACEFWRGTVNGPSLTGYHSRLSPAARAYFDTHPEPKPWHDPKEGEVWVLTLDDGEVEMECAASFHGGRFHTSNGGAVPLDGDNPDACAQIIAGRRIWPEDAHV